MNEASALPPSPPPPPLSPPPSSASAVPRDTMKQSQDDQTDVVEAPPPPPKATVDTIVTTPSTVETEDQTPCVSGAISTSISIKEVPGTLAAVEGIPRPIHSNDTVNRDPFDDNDKIPQAFIQGCQNDMVEARRRWQITKKWRHENQIDDILNQPQPYFEVIKQLYPHGVHKQNKAGLWVYIERPGYGRLDKLSALGITMADLERHYAFITEYLWRVLEPRNDGQVISIFDVEKCALADLAGDRLKMFKKCTALVGAHYPERSNRIFIIHSPWYATTGWGMISPFLDPRTSNKVKIHNGSCRKPLAPYVDMKDLPTVIGGSDTVPFGDSDAERDLLALVRHLNKRHGVKALQLGDPPIVKPPPSPGTDKAEEADQ